MEGSRAGGGQRGEILLQRDKVVVEVRFQDMRSILLEVTGMYDWAVPSCHYVRTEPNSQAGQASQVDVGPLLLLHIQVERLYAYIQSPTPAYT